jgi:hypothetical protein
VGNAGQPRQRTVSTTERAGVAQAPVQRGGSIVGAADLSSIVRGLQPLLRVGAIDSEDQQLGTQGGPCQLVC